ncbi:site-specific DNA-methyltransferase [Pasteurella atlantica]|uniref:site-specific DNA-methyltransferase n=1 Tax=Pasteurellaceae TaxID=712 RepID=UPI002758D731|nr:site-specific DNA-methyltransferase [Pasteurella atlantica]MDP8115879.1 site-specific DNA-methyltransferase [Pasteurella atlantica]
MIDYAEKYDQKLLSSLLNNPKLKQQFFINVDETLVFKLNNFRFFLEENKINNSYTQFKNRIGLTSGQKFFKNCNDVVLDFPYKDCVLAGGQSSEEGKDVIFEYDEKVTKSDEKKGYKANAFNKKSQKRQEIFFNNVLAADEIDRLFDNKALINWKKFSPDSEEKPTAFHRNEQGIITDNLIIKGNNLLALHSLKSEFAGQVKLIYIDPPYNTGNDGFKYNDNFNHSTWLTFMKNRLEIAKDLLSDDGSIFIQIDDFEDAYLKVLCDEVFERENFRNKITWKRRGGSANPTNRLNNVTDYILWYSKNPNDFQFFIPYTKDDENTKKYIKERFNNVDENNRKFMKSPLQSPNPRPTLMYEYKGYKTPKNGWAISKEKMEEWDKQGKLWFPDDKNKNINRKIYLDEYVGQPVSSLWTDISVINPMSNERSDFDKGQKPEKLIQRIIEIATKKGDIVLDFHLGSGTTAAVAHKMNRQYIGVEQMDYIETIAVERLKKVIAGEQGGISKAVNWQGGGEFIYCELAEFNQAVKNQIKNANSYEELTAYFDEIYNNYFLHYNIATKQFVEQQIQSEQFKVLGLDEQKAIFCAMLDNNQLYVNQSEIDDEQFAIDEQDKVLSKAFYGECE